MNAPGIVEENVFQLVDEMVRRRAKDI